MKLLIFFVRVFIILSVLQSCAVKKGSDGDDGRERERRPPFEEDPDLEGDDQEGLMQECPEEGYMLFSNQECELLTLGSPLHGHYGHPAPGMGAAEEVEYGPYKKRLVDFVFVVDSTNVMDYYLWEKEGFLNRFSSFLSEINPHLDWSAVFITADHSDSGKFLKGAFQRSENGRAFALESDRGLLNLHNINPATPLYSSLFMYAITRYPKRNTVHTSIQRHRHRHQRVCSFPPYCQRKYQQPLKALRASFAKNKKFMRNEADLAVVILTNSDEKPSKKSQEVTPQEVVAEFQRVYGKRKKLWAFNIIILPGDQDCKAVNGKRNKKSAYGEIVSKLPALTGGGNFSICLNSYAPVAQGMVRVIRGGVTKSEQLGWGEKESGGFSENIGKDPFDASMGWK